MLLVLALFAVLASCIHYTAPSGMETSRESFEGFKTYFSKTYETEAAETHAYRNFVASVRRVKDKNTKFPSTVSGLTKFADLSPQEFKDKILMKLPNQENKIPKNKGRDEEEAAAPTEAIDWVKRGATTAVKNQLSCGSCWTFSATETIESANLIAGKINNQTLLAPQEIVDCDSEGYGCSGGWPSQAMQWVISKGGLDTESSYPYTGTDQTCAAATGTVGATISAVVQVAANEQKMYEALRTMPLSICADASNWMDYSSGIFPSSECTTQIDHAIQLTGYNPSQGGYWIVRNSWGADWGLNGFIWLQFGQDACGITEYVAYAKV